jgi:hypothetical protein
MRGRRGQNGYFGFGFLNQKWIPEVVTHYKSQSLAPKNCSTQGPKRQVLTPDIDAKRVSIRFDSIRKNCQPIKQNLWRRATFGHL